MKSNKLNALEKKNSEKKKSPTPPPPSNPLKKSSMVAPLNKPAPELI
jgi:hypothetical protein